MGKVGTQAVTVSNAWPDLDADAGGIARTFCAQGDEPRERGP